MILALVSFHTRLSKEGTSLLRSYYRPPNAEVRNLTSISGITSMGTRMLDIYKKKKISSEIIWIVLITDKV